MRGIGRFFHHEIIKFHQIIQNAETLGRKKVKFVLLSSHIRQIAYFLTPEYHLAS